MKKKWKKSIFNAKSVIFIKNDPKMTILTL